MGIEIIAAGVAVVAAVMGAVLVVVRSFLEQSPLEAVGLTALGAARYLAGLRLARILGVDRLEAVRRHSEIGLGNPYMLREDEATPISLIPISGLP